MKKKVVDLALTRWRWVTNILKTRVVCLSLGNTEFEMLARQGKKLASALVVPKGRLVTASTK